MPRAVTAYLRHLATRCHRIASDSDEQHTAKELELISLELIERARDFETLLAPRDVSETPAVPVGGHPRDP